MVDQPNSRMKVARTAGTFSIPCVCQSWPPLAVHPGFVSGPCSGTEKHLRTFRTLILSSGSSCLLNSTSFPRLKTLLLLEVQRRRGKLLQKTFPCTRMLAPHSIPRLRILLQASKWNSAVSGEECACSRCLWKAFAPTNHPALSWLPERSSL